VTLLPVAWGTAGAGYAVGALLLGGAFLFLTLRLRREPSRRGAALLFHYSLLYLALLFVVMAVDVL
jgi:protoheme IX farnesyltransferase